MNRRTEWRSRRRATSPTFSRVNKHTERKSLAFAAARAHAAHSRQQSSQSSSPASSLSPGSSWEDGGGKCSDSATARVYTGASRVTTGWRGGSGQPLPQNPQGGARNGPCCLLRLFLLQAAARLAAVRRA